MAEDGFPLSGSIDEKAFPFLLMDLHRQGATGSLKVDGPAYQKALYFRGGRVLFGSSNDPKDQLGAILIESGRITPEQLEDVNAKVGPGSPLAKVLAESGFVSQRELSEAARAKVERILADVISYDSGAFEFEDGVLPKGAVDLKLATDKLVLSAVRRVTERAFVLRHVASLETVLVLAPDAAPRLAEIQQESEHLGDFLDGRRNLKEVAAAARIDEFEAAKVACGFLFLGLARVEQPQRVSGPEDSGFAIVEGDELDLGGGRGLPASSEPSSDSPVEAFSSSSQDEDAPLDPSRFASPIVAGDPEPEASPKEPERPKRSLEPETLFIEPPAAPERALPLTQPPRRPTPSDTKPPVVSEIHLPSLADVGYEAAGDRTEAAPKSRPPSRDDLAALDALLNSNSLEGPLTPLEKPSESPRTDTRYGSVPRPQGRRSSGGARRALSLVAVLVLLAGAGAFAFYRFYPQAPSRTPTPLPPPTTRPVATTTMPAAETPAPPSPTSAVASAAPPATTVATTLPPTPVTTLPPARPTPAPKGAAAAAASGDSIAEARTSMERGDFSRAARAFAAQLRKAERGSFSIQLLVACSEETLSKAAQNVASRELFIVPVEYKGRSCYRVCWGIYDSESAARGAVSSIPEYFHKGGATPKAVSVPSILP